MRNYIEVLNYQHPTYPGMNIRVSHTSEDIPIRDQFDDQVHDVDDLIDKVNRGIYDWFMVCVEVYYNGSLQGSDYLGGCMYEDANDAIENGLDGYLEDMVDRAVNETLMLIKTMKDNIDADFPQGVPEAA